MDDELTILFAYRKLFEREGYQVDLCESPEQSISMLQTHCYFAVISDLRFAGNDNEDGLKLLISIREKQPHVKLILVTGNADAFRGQSWHHFGVSHFFEKPVQPDLLLNALQNNT